MEIILDTNFLITCIKQKIQFLEQINQIAPNAKIVIPSEVIDELEKIKESKKATLNERQAAELAIFIIKKKGIKIESLGLKSVDSGILRYSIKNPDTIIATLDKELKIKIKNKNNSAKFLIIRQKKKIEINCP